jgi:hypothetical protein
MAGEVLRKIWELAKCIMSDYEKKINAITRRSIKKLMKGIFLMSILNKN